MKNLRLNTWRQQSESERKLNSIVGDFWVDKANREGWVKLRPNGGRCWSVIRKDGEKVVNRFKTSPTKEFSVRLFQDKDIKLMRMDYMGNFIAKEYEQMYF